MDQIERRLRDTASMAEALDIAKMLKEMKSCPDHHKDSTPADLLIAVYTGLDMGLNLPSALAGIIPYSEKGFLIKGDQALKIVLDSGLADSWRVKQTGTLENRDYQVDVSSCRKKYGCNVTGYCYADAVQALLITEDLPKTAFWSRYAQRMIYYRALGWHIRTYYIDLIAGLHIYEEVESDTKVINNKSMVANSKVLRHIKERIDKNREL